MNGITRVKLTIERSAAVIAISPDGMLMATASGVNEQPDDIQLWHLADGRLLGKLSGHNRGVTDLRFSADDRNLVSCSWEPAVRVWNAASGQSLPVVKGHRRATQCC